MYKMKLILSLNYRNKLLRSQSSGPYQLKSLLVILILVISTITVSCSSKKIVEEGEKRERTGILIKFKGSVSSFSDAKSLIYQIVGNKDQVVRLQEIPQRHNLQYILLEVKSGTTSLYYRFKDNEDVISVRLIPKKEKPEQVKPLTSRQSSLFSNEAWAAPKRKPNPTAPNSLTASLRGNFKDSDGDGMTDAAEKKYGYDPKDSKSFPEEPGNFLLPVFTIKGSGIGATLEMEGTGFTVSWKNPPNGYYALYLEIAGKFKLFGGGGLVESVFVSLSSYGLKGTETLKGYFSLYKGGYHVKDTPRFSFKLSKPVIGAATNRISYTFKNFSKEDEETYREFLKRVWPIMKDRLGPPAETFNCVITNLGKNSDYFMVTDGGRTFLSDASFIPRLIVHEFVHAWKGAFAFTSDKHWKYDDALSGFEEGTGEGMAFEIVHDYVRSYPDDYATKDLLSYRPSQYWSSRTTFFDSIRFNRWTGAGDFWTHSGGQRSRYSIAATTVQIMEKNKKHAYKDIMKIYYDEINQDVDFRPFRADLIGLWLDNGMPSDNTNAFIEMPVLQGHKLDEGIYILNTIRPYGAIGDQQFAACYANKDGETWWGIDKSEIKRYKIPPWLKYDLAKDGKYYIDTQGQKFTVSVTNHLNKNVATVKATTKIERSSDGTANGLGWVEVKKLAMENFNVGLYKEDVDFSNYSKHDQGGKEAFYFFGLKGLKHDKANEYIIMIGVVGAASGQVSIEIQGKKYTEQLKNGAAVFRSTKWPFDLEGRFPITIVRGGKSHTYYRTLLEAGTYHNYFQHQFIIFDKDFDGIEKNK